MQDIIRLLTILLFVFPAFALAQNATLRGKVTDEKTGEELIGVNVYIEGTTNGSSADLNGNYSLTVPPGNYTLIASFISYSTKTIKDIKVKAGEVKRIDISLGQSAINMQEIVIEARQVKNTENALLAMQKRSVVIQDAISSQEIKRSGAGNAAESAKQVTGVSVVDGKHIFVRGLGDRYTYTQLNGITLQSPDPYRNSAQLDMIPASLLDNIITGKTFTPDQPGTFTGGNVNLTTKSYPDKLYIHLSSSVSWNPQSSFNKNFISHKGGETDWLGFDDGGREMPVILKNEEIRDRLTAAYYIKARNYDDTARVLDQVSKSLNPNMAPIAKKSFTGTSYSFSMGNQKKVFGNPFGFIMGLNFKTNYSYYENGTSAAYEAGGGSDAEVLFERFSFSDRNGTENPQMNGLLSLNYQAGKHHEIGTTIILNKDTEKNTRYLSGEAPGFTGRDAPLESRVLSFTERSLQTYQLKGKHRLPILKDIEINWLGGYTLTEMKQPDLRFFANEIVDDTLYQINPASYNLPTHFFRNLNDTMLEGKIDIIVPLSEKKKSSILKAGVYASRKDRTFSEYNFYYRQAPRYMGMGAEPYKGDPDLYFGSANTGWIDTTTNGRNVIGNYAVNGSDPKNQYRGLEEVRAAYLMTVIDAGKKVKIVTGLRAEHTRMEVAGNDSTGNFCWDLNQNMTGDPEEDLNGDGKWDLQDCGDYGKINQLDFLPSLSLIYALSEKSNLRTSISRTIARPTMRELAPFSSFDFIGGFVYIGNPLLKHSSILNYDLRWEFFPKPGELIAVSSFYKQFTDPIVKIYNPETSNPEIIFANSSKAKVYGLELEFRKSLSGVSGLLKNFKVHGNFSYILSKVDLDTAEYRNAVALNPEIQTSRAFAGQSPWIANAGLNYRNDSLGIDLSVYYNYFAKRLAELGQNGLPDSYEQGRSGINFNLVKEFGKNFSIRLAGANLLNAPYRKVQEFKGREYIISDFRLGPEFTFGINWNIGKP